MRLGQTARWTDDKSSLAVAVVISLEFYRVVRRPQ